MFVVVLLLFVVVCLLFVVVLLLLMICSCHLLFDVFLNSHAHSTFFTNHSFSKRNACVIGRKKK